MSRLNQKSNDEKILVSAVGGDIGSGIAKIFYDAGKSVIGCDVAKNPGSREVLSEFVVSPPASAGQQYIDWVIDHCMKKKIATFIPTNEIEIRLVAPMVDLFSRSGIRVLVNNQEIVQVFSDKYLTANYLREQLSLDTPKSVILADFVDQISFPLIIKPRSGRGSHSIFKAIDRIDLDYARHKLDTNEFVFQEYIGTADEEYTTAIFSDGTNVSSITFRRLLGLGGLSREVVLVQDTTMERISIDLAKKLKLVGSINVQSRKQSDRHVIFEVNPRLSSTISFRKFFGFDDVIWWYEVSQGRSYAYVPKYGTGTGKRVLSEVYFDLAP